MRGKQVRRKLDQWYYAMEKKVQRLNWRDSEDYSFVVSSQNGAPSTNSPVFLKHIYRETNREADHMASLGAAAVVKVTVEGGFNNTEL